MIRRQLDVLVTRQAHGGRDNVSDLAAVEALAAEARHPRFHAVLAAPFFDVAVLLQLPEEVQEDLLALVGGEVAVLDSKV